ncbi:hypothetical protein FRB90_005911 [Tulasnella sp. 427]|nr:hypothetical protein FRB90_005911 [Tulasnella sp. 427]
MYQIGSPLVTTRNVSNVATKVASAYPPMGVPQPPILAVGQDVRRQAEPSRQAPAVPPFDPHSYTLGSAFDVDAGRMAEVQPEESYYRPPASAVYPLTQQHRLPRPQIPRQSSMHSIPSAIPALTPARSHSIHFPSREKAYPLMQNAAQPQQPLAASPSPSTEMPQLSPARLTPSRIRTNGSAPFPQQSTEPSSPSSPQTTGTKRSYDEIDGSELEEEDAQGEEEIDEDADGEEDESELSPAMQALVNRPAVIIPRDSKGQAKEKRAKTGRPKSTRASAQKDPKRAKLFCPRPGCTKRYMNPNGLKYHLEKGTCTIEV